MAEAAREKIVERLAAAVEADQITQGEMDEMLSWHDAKPDALDEPATASAAFAWDL